jgi:hypothetical protein
VKRSGVADLPLHGGRVPPWLAVRMVTLGTAIAESVLYHYGRSALLGRLIAVLRRSLDAAKLGRSDKLDGMSRLDAFVRAIEDRRRPEAAVAATIAHERRISRSLGGRMVFDDRREATQPHRGQLELFES